MSSDKDRLPIAQWILERNLAWVAAAEVKVAVIVTIDMALLGSIEAAYSSANAATRTACADLFWTISAAIFVAAGIFCAAMADYHGSRAQPSLWSFLGVFKHSPNLSTAKGSRAHLTRSSLETWLRKYIEMPRSPIRNSRGLVGVCGYHSFQSYRGLLRSVCYQ